MEPYQRAGDNLRERNALPGKLVKGAASVAGNAALAASGAGLASAGVRVASKVMPFLSEHIPMSLAIKGLSKINPKLGQFVSKAMDEGYDFEEVKQFIGEKMEPKQEPAKQDIEKKDPSQSNLLGQFSPELQSFIEQQIQSGKAPDHAAASAMPRAEFSELIRDIEKKTKKKFTALVRELYEGKAVQQAESQQQAQPAQAMAQPQQAQGQDLSNWTKGLNPNLKQFERPEQQGQGLDPGVAQILQQGQALLSKFKGG